MAPFGHEIEATAYQRELKRLLHAVKGDQALFSTIVNAPFHDRRYSTTLSLGVVVLLLVNKKDKTIDRIALSDTDSAKGAINMSVKPFKSIRIPLNAKVNIIADVVRTGKPATTADWQYLFNPELAPEEARFNQAGAGIGCSIVYPLKGAEAGGALIFSYYQSPDKIAAQHHSFMASYTELVTDALKT